LQGMSKTGRFRTPDGGNGFYLWLVQNAFYLMAKGANG